MHLDICLDFEEEGIINRLPDNNFVEDIQCHNGRNDKPFFVKFGQTYGWPNCASNNVLTIDLEKMYIISLLKVAGMVSQNEIRIITTFTLQYSNDNINWEKLYAYNQHHEFVSKNFSIMSGVTYDICKKFFKIY